jgi:hypothetical protein
VSCLLLVSCFDKGDCLFTNTNLVKVDFMNYSRPLESLNVEIDSIFIPDRGYFVGSETVSGVVLLVDPRLTEMTYVFQYRTRSDTLVLGYSNQTMVLSPDCGSYIYQDNLEVKYSTFEVERVKIIERKLATSVTTNIEILF